MGDWLDDKGAGPWNFAEIANKTEYNEGDLIATEDDPVWDVDDDSGVPITPEHDPCGYWFNNHVLRDPDNPPSPAPLGGKLYATGMTLGWSHHDQYKSFRYVEGGRLFTDISRSFSAWGGVYSPGSIMIIDGDGALWVWGDNHKGQLGVGDWSDHQGSHLVQSGTATDWKMVTTGYTHSFGVRGEERQLYSCGENGYGALGIGSTTDKNTWQIVPGMTGIVDIAASGDQYSAVIKSDGTMWVCGGNSYGALGLYNNNESAKYKTFTKVTTETMAGGGQRPSENWAKVICNAACIYGIKIDGSLWAAGDSNYHFEIAYYDPAYSRDGIVCRYFQPADGGRGLDVADAEGNANWGGALITADGEVWMIGTGQFYIFGHGGAGSTWHSVTLPSGASKIVKIRGAVYHSMLLSDEGKLYVAGTEDYDESYGCLGLGGVTSQAKTYTEVPLGFDVADIGCGSGFSFIIRD